MENPQTQSLLSYLTTRNPVLSRCMPNGRTITTNSSWSQPDDIREWTDFDIQTLRSMYNGDLADILSRRHALSSFEGIPSYPFCQISDENSLERLLVRWTQSVVSAALEVAQNDSPLQKFSRKIYMASGGQARWQPAAAPETARSEAARSVDSTDTTTATMTTTANAKKESKRSEGKRSFPDWAGIKVPRQQADNNGLPVYSSTSSLPFNLLPGDTKLSAKWTSESVSLGSRSKLPEKSTKHKGNSPILQVFNYCLSAESRYGYLITDRELCVVRVKVLQCSCADKRHEKGNSLEIKQQIAQNGNDGKTRSTVYESDIVMRARQHGLVEYKSIPWNASGNDDLTINLALWWLHVLASNGNTLQDDYLDLDKETLCPTATSSFNAAWSGLRVSGSSVDSEPVPARRTVVNASTNRKRRRPAGNEADARKRTSFGKDN